MRGAVKTRLAADIGKAAALSFYRRTPMVPHGLFGTVRWSTKHALTDTLAGLPKSFRVAMLGELDDIDDGAAWTAWRTEPRV